MELVSPYWHTQTSRQEQRDIKMKQVSQDPHNLLPPFILEEQSSFVSKTFLIRYCDESIEMNDLIQFRTEIDLLTDYLRTDFCLEVELYFSDLSSLGGPTGWKQNSHRYHDCKFKLVQTQRFNIRNSVTGLCETITVNFNGQFQSVMDLQIQAALTNLKLSPDDKITNPGMLQKEYSRVI